MHYPHNHQFLSKCVLNYAINKIWESLCFLSYVADTITARMLCCFSYILKQGHILWTRPFRKRVGGMEPQVVRVECGELTGRLHDLGHSCCIATSQLAINHSPTQKYTLWSIVSHPVTFECCCKSVYPKDTGVEFHWYENFNEMFWSRVGHPLCNLDIFLT